MLQFQQILALVIIISFLIRLFWRKHKKDIKINEFVFWLVFWILVACLIISIKWIDLLIARLGFSASGIEILLYLGIVVLFYFIFQLRLKVEKMDRDITKITREIALKHKNTRTQEH